MPKHATCYYYPTSGTVVSGTVVLRFLEKTIRADSFCANVLLRPSPREVRVRRKGKRGKEVGKETMKRSIAGWLWCQNKHSWLPDLMRQRGQIKWLPFRTVQEGKERLLSADYFLFLAFVEFCLLRVLTFSPLQLLLPSLYRLPWGSQSSVGLH